MAGYLVLAALGLVAIAAVAFPLIAGRARYEDPDELERDLDRYRAALAAGTVCRRCRFANGAGSRYCAECGHRLEPQTGEAGTAGEPDAGAAQREEPASQ